MATTPEQMTQQLVRLYEKAERELQRVLLNGATAYTRRRAELSIQQIEAIVENLSNGQNAWAKASIARSYRFGISWAKDQPQMPVLPSMTLVDRRAVEVAIQRTLVDLGEALQSVAPYVSRVWMDTQQALVREQALAEQIAIGRVEGLGPRELSRRIKATLQDGATGRLAESNLSASLIEDLGAAGRGEYVSILCKDGVTRRYQMAQYSKLVAHTQTSMAANEGALNMAQVAGIDLVQWSVHDNPCEECLLLQGEVFSVSGDSPDFPTLTDDETPPIHPNCGHRLLPVSEDWLREEGQYDTLAEFSNSPNTVNTADEYAELLA